MHKKDIIIALLGLFLLWFFMNQGKFTNGGGGKNGKGRGGGHGGH